MTAQRGIVCAGNWIVDIIHDISQWPEKSDLVSITEPNGRRWRWWQQMLHSTWQHCKLIIRVWPAGLLGCDTHGDLVRRACQDAGLPVEHLGTITEVCTAHTHVMNVTGDSRTFFYNAGANAHFDAHTLSMKAIAAHRPSIFYLGYLNLLPLLDAMDGQGRTGAAEAFGASTSGGNDDLR